MPTSIPGLNPGERIVHESSRNSQSHVLPFGNRGREPRGPRNFPKVRRYSQDRPRGLFGIVLNVIFASDPATKRTRTEKSNKRIAQKLTIAGLARVDKTPPRRVGVTVETAAIRRRCPFFFPSRERQNGYVCLGFTPAPLPSVSVARRSYLDPLRGMKTTIAIREVCERFLFPSFVNATSTSSSVIIHFYPPTIPPSPRVGTSSVTVNDRCT